MLTLSLLRDNLLSVPVLMYALGFLSNLLKHDLRLPNEVYRGISMYLLFAIGLKGGVALQSLDALAFLSPILATLCAGVIIPAFVYFICRKLLSLQRMDAGALAAHYGSVSAVTFIAAVKLLEAQKLPYMPGFPVILTLMEVTGIVVGLAFAQRQPDWKMHRVFFHVFSSQSILLLIGGMLVGALASADSLQHTHLLFHELFYGLLGFFLLDMGVATAQKLSHFHVIGAKLASLAIFAPIVQGCLGVLMGKLFGFNVGSTAIFATLCASASYIAAPAAVRQALPEANSAYYLTCSMAITFPFNLTFGIPLYFFLSFWAINP